MEKRIMEKRIIESIMQCSCRYCKQQGHSISTCKNAIVLKSDTEKLAALSMIDRYNSIQIIQDDISNELCECIDGLTYIELCILNEEIATTMTKRQLVAKYIANSIEKIYNYYKEIPSSRRRITQTRMHRIFCEKTYWQDIAEGISQEIAKESFYDGIREYCIELIEKSHKFPITTVLLLYNNDCSKSSWECADKIDDFKYKTIECSVCIDTCKFTDSIKLNCSHEFCGDCFGKILKKCSNEFSQTNQTPSCPLCRQMVKEIHSSNTSLMDLKMRKYCLSDPMIKKVFI